MPPPSSRARMRTRLEVFIGRFRSGIVARGRDLICRPMPRDHRRSSGRAVDGPSQSNAGARWLSRLPFRSHCPENGDGSARFGRIVRAIRSSCAADLSWPIGQSARDRAFCRTPPGPLTPGSGSSYSCEAAMRRSCGAGVNYRDTSLSSCSDVPTDASDSRVRATGQTRPTRSESGHSMRLGTSSDGHPARSSSTMPGMGSDPCARARCTADQVVR